MTEPTSRSEQQARSLGAETIGGSLWTAGATVGSAVLSAASTIIVARSLGGVAFGRYNYLFYVVTLATTLSTLGITARITNSLMSAVPLGDWGRVKAEMTTLLRFSVVRSVVVAAVVVAFLRRDPVAAFIGGASTILQISTTALSTGILAQKRFRLLSVSALAVTVAQSILTSWVAIATSNAELTLGVFLVGQVVAAAFAVAYAPWWMLRRPSSPRSSSTAGRSHLSTQLSFYAFGVCQLIVFGKSETIVLGYTDQAIALGFFAVATTVAARATLLMDALHGALLPGLGEASTRDREAVGRAYSTSIRFSSLLVLLTALVLGPPLIVYGPVVLGASGSMVQTAAALTLAGSLLQSFVYPLTVVSSVEMQRSAIVLPSLVGAVVDVAAAIALIPHYGLYGATAASVLAALTYTGILIIIVRLPRSAVVTLRAQSLRVVTVVIILTSLGVATRTWSHSASLVVVALGVVVSYAASGIGRGVLAESDLTALGRAVPRSSSVPIAARRALRSVLLVRRLNSDDRRPD